ncbi:TonB-dependent receptor plug domain-containing protein [Ferruginibacter paludis]|uniref:TonB-dependent receptor n=1 Tax=Ferruginibacter paludis TaxID=1310417 RepID=UPI0025B46E57|nr:TonB-dependent receptor [Ferruginibacter paludis]MDN3656749.1 TonB-dependent receptor plug domain-containing protein [Ferruginibacter paludis]
MYKILFLFFISGFTTHVFSQYTFKAIIKNNKTNEHLRGVSVILKGTQHGATSNDSGFAALNNIPNGKQTILIQSVEFTTVEKNVLFPLSDTVTIFLEPAADELEEIKIVSSTRSSRNIQDIPTRIEGIPLADLEEKSVMQPGNIKMLVSEISGVQTQQTSQVSGSASIRIQGLDGKYTQLLQDGFPIYSGFAGGLSVLQIPPLNLKRVEVIKGATSTLYGGGAIAGLINLITKEPGDKREISFLANTNQTGALDCSGFYAERYKKTGLTMYTAGNFQKAYDNNKDGFSDIPKYKRYSINPRFFYYPNASTTFSIGINTGFEKRTGGDMQVINNMADTIHSFFEINNTNRYSTQAKFEKIFASKNRLTIKNSIGYFNRTIERPVYNFEGKQVATFSEANYLIPKEKSEWNVGANFVSDHFRQVNAVANKLDYFSSAFGLFAQNNLRVSEKLIVESGLRLDVTKRNDFFVLPRFSLLYKITNKFTSRIGGGLGYKTPSIFSEDAEEKAFQNIYAPDFSKVYPEKSYGLNADVNYKTTIFEDINFSINQLFFYTSIKHPLVLYPVAVTNNFSFQNANGNIEAKGFETSIKLKLDNIACFIGYTYTDVNRHFNNVSSVNPLTAKHHLNIDMMYEWNEKLRIGYELFYVGQQYLSNNEKVRDYWITGVSSEYKFDHFSLFLNLENFLDTRQSKWESMYAGTIQHPQFREVYTPTDGFIFNGGFKISL